MASRGFGVVWADPAGTAKFMAEVRREPRRGDEGGRARQVKAPRRADAAPRCVVARRRSSSGTSRASRPCRARSSARRWFPGLIAVGLVHLRRAARRAAACASARRWVALPRLAPQRRARVAGVAVAARRAAVLRPRRRHARLPSHRVAPPGRCWMRVLGASWRVTLPVARHRDAASSTSRSTSCCACRCPGACSSASLSEMTRDAVLVAGVRAGVRAVRAVGDPRLGAVRPVRRRGAGPDRDDGDGAARAGDLLHAADAGDRRDRHRDGDGDLRRRHPGLPAAHAGHAGLGRLHRRGLRDDEEGPGRDSRSARAWCSRRSAACSAPRC